MAHDLQHDSTLSIRAYQRVPGFWPGMVDARQNSARLQALGGAPAKKQPPQIR